MAIDTAPAPATPPGPSVGSQLEEQFARRLGPMASLFDQFTFYGRVLKGLPQGWRYRKEIVNLISDITIGAGALIVGGGMFFVIFAMSFFTGTQVGLEGFKGLQQIGAEAFTGIISSVANTREITP